MMRAIFAETNDICAQMQNLNHNNDKVVYGTQGSYPNETYIDNQARLCITSKGINNVVLIIIAPQAQTHPERSYKLVLSGGILH